MPTLSFWWHRAGTRDRPRLREPLLCGYQILNSIFTNLLNSCPTQGGKPRAAADTVASIHAQIRAAGLGVAKTVAEMQTESGVKDPLAEFWIQKLIVLAREKQQVRIRNPATRDPRLNPRRVLNRPAIVSEIEAEIQEELMRWLVTQPDADFQCLPPDSRELVTAAIIHWAYISIF